MARERPKRERERRSATEGDGGDAASSERRRGAAEGNGGDASSSDVAEERGGHAQGTVLDMRLEDEGLVVDVEARDSQIEKNKTVKRLEVLHSFHTLLTLRRPSSHNAAKFHCDFLPAFCNAAQRCSADTAAQLPVVLLSTVCRRCARAAASSAFFFVFFGVAREKGFEREARGALRAHSRVHLPRVHHNRPGVLKAARHREAGDEVCDRCREGHCATTIIFRQFDDVANQRNEKHAAVCLLLLRRRRTISANKQSHVAVREDACDELHVKGECTFVSLLRMKRREHSAVGGASNGKR